MFSLNQHCGVTVNLLAVKRLIEKTKQKNQTNKQYQ